MIRNCRFCKLPFEQFKPKGRPLEYCSKECHIEERRQLQADRYTQARIRGLSSIEAMKEAKRVQPGQSRRRKAR